MLTNLNPLRSSYEDAISLFIDEDEVLTVVEQRDDNTYRVRVTATWLDTPRVFSLNLRVPTVTPITFPWDDGLHGWVVQMPGGSERFCHPRLRSDVADALARERDRSVITRTTLWNFYWEGFYDRLWSALREGIIRLADSRQRMDVDLVRSHLQRSVTQLLAGTRTEDEEGETFSGLPLTDDAQIQRQMFELELGYPDVMDTWSREQLKLVFLREVDPHCDIVHTGKNKVGRYVMRVRPEAPLSAVTQRPLPDIVCALNAFAVHANPTRVYRENRGATAGALDLVQPERPLLRMQGFGLPAPLARKLTNLTVAFVDIPGLNCYLPGEHEIQEYAAQKVTADTILCLDKFLVCPSGIRKLKARQERSDLLTEDRWLERKAELEQLPGFRSEYTQELVEILGANPVYRHEYRYWFEREIWMRIDKLKCTYGGLKAITWPIPQLYVGKGGEVQPVDLVIAEQTVLAKGAKDALWAALCPDAGITEVSPLWSEEEIVNRIETGLVANHHPASGRFPVYRRDPSARRGRSVDPTENSIFERLSEVHQQLFQEMFQLDPVVRIDGYDHLTSAIVGSLPFYRAPETEHRQSSTRTGVAVNIHARNCVGVPFPERPVDRDRTTELAEFYNLCSAGA